MSAMLRIIKPHVGYSIILYFIYANSIENKTINNKKVTMKYNVQFTILTITY